MIQCRITFTFLCLNFPNVSEGVVVAQITQSMAFCALLKANDIFSVWCEFFIFITNNANLNFYQASFMFCSILHTLQYFFWVHPKSPKFLRKIKISVLAPCRRQERKREQSISVFKICHSSGFIYLFAFFSYSHFYSK